MYRTTSLFLGFLVSFAAVAAMPAYADRVNGSKNAGAVKPAQATPQRGPKPGQPVKPAKPEIVKPEIKPGKRNVWNAFWNSKQTRLAPELGFAGVCKVSNDGALATASDGATNTAEETARLNCRMSLREPGVHYQLSVLTDHSTSETFNCAAGAILKQNVRDQYDTQTVAGTTSEDPSTTDRDEWGFISSRRLQTLELRCRIPAGGSVREVALIDCRLGECPAVAEEDRPRPGRLTKVSGGN